MTRSRIIDISALKAWWGAINATGTEASGGGDRSMCGIINNTNELVYYPVIQYSITNPVYTRLPLKARARKAIKAKNQEALKWYSLHATGKSHDHGSLELLFCH